MNDEQRALENELLVLRCQEGDKTAFRDLMARWQRPLWLHAWRLTHQEEAAWDVSQDAWTAIAGKLGGLENAAAFPAWAYRIVSNKARDWVRREARRRQAMADLAEETDPEPFVPQARVSAEADLAAILKRLPVHDRVLLSLKYEQGFSLSEMADILSTSAGTIKTQLFRARERARKLLEEQADE